jgi:hypothetical protein
VNLVVVYCFASLELDLELSRPWRRTWTSINTAQDYTFPQRYSRNLIYSQIWVLGKRLLHKYYSKIDATGEQRSPRMELLMGIQRQFDANQYQWEPKEKIEGHKCRP